MSLLALTPQAGAQKAPAKIQKSKNITAPIITEGALVYAAPDFDSNIIAELRAGEKVLVDTRRRGPFYRVKTSTKKVGWVADVDIAGGVERFSTQALSAKKETQKKLKEKQSNQILNATPFNELRHWGPVLQMTQFTEDTMGKKRSEFRPTVGLKFVGNNTLFSGEIFTESNLLVDIGAPNYYADATGFTAKGFTFYSDFMFQTVKMWGEKTYYFYGMGPLVRWSHFQLKQNTTEGIKSYSSDEIGLGAVFNLGWAFRVGHKMLRLDAKYHWERAHYPSAGFFFGFDF